MKFKMLPILKSRITEEHDATTEEGFQFVSNLIDICCSLEIMLMAAMPCTGGSMWMKINKLCPGVKLAAKG